MNFFPRAASICSALLLAGSCLGASVVGTWRGHFDFSGMKVPAGASPDQKKMMGEFKARMAAVRFTMVFKADKTYTTSMAGGAVAKSSPHTGTWSQSGNEVTTKGQRGTEKLQMSPGGKTLIATPKRGNGIRIVFSR